MIEQDGFVTTYDSHDRRILAEIFNAKPAESTSPTQFESFKFEDGSCSNCGGHVSENDHFCANCGAVIKHKEESK